MFKPTNENIEELSTLLDKLNAGTKPDSQDEETAELLEVAAFVKNAGLSVPPPPHIVEQTVERIITVLPKPREKRPKTWLYSGVLGIAASTLLVIGLNGFPWETKQLPPVVVPPVVSTPQATPPIHSGDAKPPLVSPAAALPATPLVETAPSAPIPDNAPKASEPVYHKEITQHEQPPKLSPAPILIEETPTAADTPKLARRFAASPPAKLKSATSPPRALTLPGQKPDSISQDPESGTLSQHFHTGTPQEITIVQRTLPLDSSTVKASSAALTESKESSPQPRMNKVTIQLYGQEITVEGRQTKDELQKIAASLQP